ncbi:hypothetical protein [Streptomyces luteogriseus]|uniref:hypothetical protein n=1 Tax=Streptomyces luteogriseus TaxID=68233 RepID=UPI00381E4202
MSAGTDTGRVDIRDDAGGVDDSGSDMEEPRRRRQPRSSGRHRTREYRLRGQG